MMSKACSGAVVALMRCTAWHPPGARAAPGASDSILTVSVALTVSGHVARAEVGLAVHAEGGATHMVGDRSSELGWGGVGLVAPELVLGRAIGLELPLAVAGLAQSSYQNPAYQRAFFGSAFLVAPGIRVRPLAGRTAWWGDGLWIAAGGGVADTGGVVCPAVDARLGVDLRVGGLALGPYLGFLEIIDTVGGPLASNASLASVGLHAVWERRSAVPVPSVQRPDVVQPDTDGTPEAVDTCANGDPNAATCDEAEAGTLVAERPQLFMDLAEQIFFAFNSSVIEPSGLAAIRAIADALLEHQEYRRIEIQGHADERGGGTYNLRLSAGRANAVRDRLIELGVDARRLNVAYFGSRRPRRYGTSEAALRENRRVELSLIRARFETVPATPKPGAQAKETNR